MDKARELNYRYNMCCDTIDTCCFYIVMGTNVERNQKINSDLQAEIDKIRAEAEQLGIELVRREKQ